MIRVGWAGGFAHRYYYRTGSGRFKGRKAHER
jgi:hypothetical protein